MIITKMALPRRTFLRGMGATLALPLLDAMVPALAAIAEHGGQAGARGWVRLRAERRRTWPNWTPTGDGTDFELSPILKPLAPFRDQHGRAVSGLDQQQARERSSDGGGEHHARRHGVAERRARRRRPKAPTSRPARPIDQIAAQELGKDTQLAVAGARRSRLDFVVGNCDNGYSCVYMNTISWRTPTTPLPMENNPRAVFERLFGEGGTAARARWRQMRKDRSILDSVTAGHGAAAEARSAPATAPTVDEYLDAVRDVERRIQKAEQQSATSSCRRRGAAGRHPRVVRRARQADVRPAGPGVSGRHHARHHVHDRARAEQPARIRRSASPTAHHAVSHHQNDPEKLAKLAKINTYHVALFALLPREAARPRPTATARCSITR